MCTGVSVYVWEVDDGHDITVSKTLRCTHFGMQCNIKNKPAARLSSNNLKLRHHVYKIFAKKHLIPTCSVAQNLYLLIYDTGGKIGHTD